MQLDGGSGSSGSGNIHSTRTTNGGGQGSGIGVGYGPSEGGGGFGGGTAGVGGGSGGLAGAGIQAGPSGFGPFGGNAGYTPPPNSGKPIKSNCFPAGTLISTESGLQPIEEVRNGQQVWAFDNHLEDWRLCKVEDCFTADYAGVFIVIQTDDEILEVTEEHPFWVIESHGFSESARIDCRNEITANSKVPGGWLKAKDLAAGDSLLLRNRKPVRIAKLARKEDRQRVYNLQVSDLHCYAVGRSQILVHNKTAMASAPTTFVAGPAPVTKPRKGWLQNTLEGGANALLELGAIAWDVGQAKASYDSMFLNKMLGTPVYAPKPKSSLFKGWDDASGQGQFYDYWGDLGISAGTLGFSNGYEAYQYGMETGDWGPYQQWAGGNLATSLIPYGGAKLRAYMRAVPAAEPAPALAPKPIDVNANPSEGLPSNLAPHSAIPHEGLPSSLAPKLIDVTGAPSEVAPPISGAPKTPAAIRLPRDINTNATPPPALPLRRPIGSSPTQNAALQADIAAARARGATDFRVNQQQVNAAGQRVGVNRPDLQYTDANGTRVYIEYDTTSSTRGPGHRTRIMANDPNGTVILRIVD